MAVRCRRVNKESNQALFSGGSGGCCGLSCLQKTCRQEFFVASDAYAASTTTSGKFTLKGDSN